MGVKFWGEQDREMLQGAVQGIPCLCHLAEQLMVEMVPLGAGEERGEVKISAKRCYNNLPLQQRFAIAINFNKRDLGLVCSSEILSGWLFAAVALGRVSDNRSPPVSGSSWRDSIAEEGT